MEKNILIINNDSLLIDYLLMALNGLRCCVKTTDTGFKGIQMLINEYFDVVIIDEFASGFDGKEVAKHALLKRKNGSPIIFGLSDNPSQIENDGFDRIYSSPLSMNDLAEIRNYFTNSIAA